jgi:4-fold beta flower protein
MAVAGLKNMAEPNDIPEHTKMIPIYNSRGEIGALLVFPYIYNLVGEWIGWVTNDRTVYSVHGHYVGTLTKDPRIVRRREMAITVRRRKPPARPPAIRPPAHLPLAPQLPELGTHMIDVLDDAPYLLPSVDFGDLRDDMN